MRVAGLVLCLTKKGDVITKLIKKYGKSVIWEKTSLGQSGPDITNQKDGHVT
jgi:hypothetical protein